MTVHNHRVLPLSQRGIRGIRSIGGITLSAENRPCFQFTAGRVHRELASRSRARDRGFYDRRYTSSLEDESFHFRTRFICQLARYPEMIYGTIVREGGGGGISELRVCGFIRPSIRNQSCAESSLPTNKFFVYLRLILPLYGFFTIESTCKILYRVLITSFEEVDSSFFLNLAHDDIFFLGRR